MQGAPRQTFLFLALMALLATAPACSKWLQAQAGGKGSEEAAVQTSDQLPGPGAQGGGGRTERSDLSAAPSLSVGGAFLEGGSYPAGDTPGDMMIARAEPSPEARERLEQIRREQAATAAAGLRDVYFDFDRFTLNDEGREALQADAEWLRSNPGRRVTIQGHCDERGTSSYNMVLGEKRARAIRNYLVDLGIEADRLAVVSFGKERPFCHERNETCYQQNRRGHLVVGTASPSPHTN